jgi:ethylbenzene hydroxylase subunit beta/complex iron-sulfur molybdoenzyme family reductase subunit beta
VRQCAGRAVFFGFIDDNEATVHRLVHEWKVALPLHAEWGTEPNVFYIPPISTHWIREDGSVDESRRRLPIEYLESLFGPRVRQALDALERGISERRHGRPSQLMKTLIAYDWKEMLGPFTRDPAELTWS